MTKCLYIYTVRIQREYGAISVLPEHKHVSNVLGATESWYNVGDSISKLIYL